MSGSKKEHTPELSTLDKIQNWYEENGNIANIVLGAVLALILLFIAYNNVWKPKKELAAAEAIFKAQHWFENDSIAKALNDSENGFLRIANKYGSTKSGNLANYYAGLCYYDLADYANAEKYLSKFNPKNDEILGGLAINVLADAQMENGKQDAALKNYKKAAQFSDNEASAPFLLLKAGMAYSYAGKTEDAQNFFETLVQEFPNTEEAIEAEKYLAAY